MSRKNKRLERIQGKQGKQASGMYEASRVNRSVTKLIPLNLYNHDHDKNVSPYNAELIRSRARELFANTPVIKGAISEIANEVVGEAFLIRSLSKDKAYKKAVEDFINRQWIPLQRWHEVLRLIVKAVIRDGDTLVVLTQSSGSNYPKITLIPAHRIHNNKHNDIIEEGIYTGYRIVKGVIINDIGEPIAYNVVNDDGSEVQYFVRDAFLVYEPDWINQVRGESALTSAITYWEDINLVNKFELLGIQNAASLALIAKVPAPQVDSFAGLADDAPLAQTSTQATQTGKEVTVVDQTLRGGQVLVFQDDSNADFKQLETSRPSQNVQAYLDNMVTLAMTAMRWPKEFSVKISLGGSDAKTLAEKIRSRVREIQNQIVYPVWHRVMGYVIGKATNNKMLPYSDDWLNFTCTYPKEFALEYLKDVKADIELLKLGIITPQQMAEAQGYDLYDNIVDKSAALKFAQEIAKRDGTNYFELIQINPNPPVVSDSTNNTNNNPATDENKA